MVKFILGGQGLLGVINEATLNMSSFTQNRTMCFWRVHAPVVLRVVGIATKNRKEHMFSV